MASMFDSAMFSPQSYNGAGGLLGNILKMIQANPAASQGFDQSNATMQPQVGPTMAQGNQGQMGGVPFPIMGQQAQQQPDPSQLPAASQPTQGVMPQQPQGLGPLLGGGQSSGGLFGGIQNKLRDMAGTLNPQIGQLNMQKQALNSSYQALVNSGVPEATARAAALNPEILKTIAPTYFDTAPKLQETGTDPLTGQKSFSIYRAGGGNPSLTPVGGGLAGGSASGPGLADFSKAIQNGVTGEALYDYVPPQMRNVVKGMVEGRQQPPTGAAMRSPQTMALIDMAHSIDPTFDSGTWGARFASQKDFSSGKSSEMVRAANQTMHHVGALLDSMDNLKNGSYPIANAAGNLWNTKVLGKGAVTEFLPNAHAVAEEMSKVFKGANLSDAEVRQWEQSLNENMSPEQQRAAVGKLVQLLNGSLQALQDKRERGMGQIASGKLGPVLNDESQKVMDRVSKWVAGDPSSQKSATLPVEGATATNPQTGKKIILKGGQWVPLQ